MKIFSKTKRCHLCNKTISLNEILRVDHELENIDEETREFIFDEMESNFSFNQNKISDCYYHLDENSLKILNICEKCYKKAFNSFMNEE